MIAAVSIIVPCYNVAPYLDVCLDSLVNQTLPDIEIICVNDGSTDDTPALLREWAQRDSRIRIIDRENGGQGAARNTGMDAAEGEYIGFVDPDDYVEHSMYARLLEEARRHETDITAGKMVPVSGSRSGGKRKIQFIPFERPLDADGCRRLEQVVQERLFKQAPSPV